MITDSDGPQPICGDRSQTARQAVWRIGTPNGVARAAVMMARYPTTRTGAPRSRIHAS
jgi:hypothetical protein